MDKLNEIKGKIYLIDGLVNTPLFFHGQTKPQRLVDEEDLQWLFKTIEQQEKEIDQLKSVKTACITEIDYLDEQLKQMKDCEDWMLKIREGLSDVEFPPGYLELAIAEPEGIYELVMYLKEEMKDQTKWAAIYHNNLQQTHKELNDTRRKRDEVKDNLALALKEIKELKQQLKEAETEVRKWGSR